MDTCIKQAISFILLNFFFPSFGSVTFEHYISSDVIRKVSCLTFSSRNFRIIFTRLFQQAVRKAAAPVRDKSQSIYENYQIFITVICTRREDPKSALLIGAKSRFDALLRSLFQVEVQQINSFISESKNYSKI